MNKENDTHKSALRILRAPKEVFTWLIIIFIFGIILLPLISVLNDIITNIVLSLRGYRTLAEVVVPLQATWVAAILRLLSIDAYTAGEYVIIKNQEHQQLVEIIWNCIGWQSLLIFIITVFVGFYRKFTLVSKTKAFIFGAVGTVLLNIFRIVVTILLLTSIDHRIAQVFHDYAALLTNTAWLLFFWWFVYSFVLEVKHGKNTIRLSN